MLNSLFAQPIYLFWPPSLLFCPSHTRCVSAPSRSLLPRWFLLKLYRAGSWFWAAPDVGQLLQHWDGAVQDKQQPWGSTWSHPNWPRTHHFHPSSTRAAVRAGQSYRIWRENLDGTRACWFRAALQRFQHPGVHHFTALRQKPLSSGTECKRSLLKFNKTFTLPPRRPNTREKTFKRLLTANLKNKEQEQKATIAQLLCLDGVVWNNIVLLPSNMELIAGLVTTSFIFVIIW